MSRRPAEVKPPPGFQGPPVSARQASPTHYLLVGVSPTQANMQTLTSLARVRFRVLSSSMLLLIDRILGRRRRVDGSASVTRLVPCRFGVF